MGVNCRDQGREDGNLQGGWWRDQCSHSGNIQVRDEGRLDSGGNERSGEKWWNFKYLQGGVDLICERNMSPQDRLMV